MTKETIFERNVPGSTEILRRKTVGIAGCGGIGSNAAVSLVRAGVGELILIDHDRVERSNLNRQFFFEEDMGRPKVEALADRLRGIVPAVRLQLHDLELAPANVPEILADADLLVEAFDRAEAKRWLIEAWCTSFPGRHIVVGSGLAGLGATDALRVHSAGCIHVCGDEETDMSLGLCAPRVAIVANMQANVAVELLVGGGEETK
ncbi:MAG: sulfur carrier protein ThiS adenylyltransferase ThiF [Candidatus Krumholzibacteriota bacterium]|nr:sulfur carrier protein ThiS adenylyltransferase ThiF [Candidatus Krumholzibacteriota bacterium]